MSFLKLGPAQHDCFFKVFPGCFVNPSSKLFVFSSVNTLFFGFGTAEVVHGQATHHALDRVTIARESEGGGFDFTLKDLENIIDRYYLRTSGIIEQAVPPTGHDCVFFKDKRIFYFERGISRIKITNDPFGNRVRPEELLMSIVEFGFWMKAGFKQVRISG